MIASFAAVFVTLELGAHSRNSATWDEPMHLTAGYVALAHRDYRVDPSHPPFMRMWAALPLLAMPIKVDQAALDRASSPEWDRDAYEFARRFVFVHNDADRLLFAARSMIVIWGLVLGLLVFAWTYEWLGFIPAVLSLIFYTLEPNMGAHASLTTTDFGVTCFTLGAVYFLWRTCRRPSRLNVSGLSIFVALAVVTKFSGLILGPIVLSLLVIAASRRRISLRQAGVVTAVVAITTLSLVWTVYRFQYAPAGVDGARLRYDDAPFAREHAPKLAQVVGWLDDRRVLPNAFTQGLLHSQATSRQLPAFLAGNYSADGWWYYFPVAILVKTPAALLVLLAAGLLVYVRQRRSLGWSNELFVLVPIVIYLGAAMSSTINIGLRHVLPVFPFLLLLAVGGAGALLTARRPIGAITIVAITAFWGGTYAAVYPHTLTFFNVFVGGPQNGFKYLSDSNLDWGQSLKALKKWMDNAGVAHVNLAYFGSADPAYYGIDCTHLPGAPTFALPLITKPRLPGYVAISATVASGVYLSPSWRLFYRGFRDQTPVATIGNALHVYWVEHWPEAADAQSTADLEAHAGLADALLFGQHWFDHAATHYRIYLDHRPGDGVMWTKLGMALTAQGNSTEAVEVLTRAVALTPNNPAAHDTLGVAWAMQHHLQEAVGAFTRALELDPDYDPARRHLAELQRQPIP
ncbi:MAG: tetratricopeptide repeat protein [Vicinamibacterales bacterium]